MMKMIQSLFSYRFPLASPAPAPPPHLAGCLRAFSELSAKGLPPWSRSTGGSGRVYRALMFCNPDLMQIQ